MSSLKPILLFYRPRYPSWRAQDIQVLHAAYELAVLGHPVTLFANRDNAKIEAADVFKDFDLPYCDRLNLQLSPVRHLGLTGIWFRKNLIQWWYQNQGVVIVRDLRRLAQWLPWLTAKQKIVIEAHQLPSIQAKDRGDDAIAEVAIEQIVLREAWGLITNCGGVMKLWEETYPELLPKYRKIIHNGTAPSRQLISSEHQPVIRCLGSLRPEKGIRQLLPTLIQSQSPIELIGASRDEQQELGPLPAHIHIGPAVAYPAVPPLLATARALLLPLQNNRFGRHLTSPLKLWDYLATDRPILAPDLASLREIATHSKRKIHLFDPDHPVQLLKYLNGNLPHTEKPYLRSWQDRAVELSGFLAQ